MDLAGLDFICQNKSHIFTTNVHEPDWADFLGDPISTKAILDCIFHHSIKVQIKGPSYRKHSGGWIR